jgi:glycosyltransferase involved in cell wall biosynthesis
MYWSWIAFDHANSKVCPIHPLSPAPGKVNLSDVSARIQGDLQSYKIPNIVHFVFGLKNINSTFSFINYAAIASVLHIQKPEKVYLHCYYEPEGFFWDLVKSHVVVRRVSLVKSIFGNRVEKYAHMADVIRLEALMQFGGIYLDIDVITLRSFDSLRGFDMVMGQEGEDGRIGLCNAVILACFDSKFLARWYDSYRTFDHKKWNEHSVSLPAKLAAKFPSEIHVASYKSFFWPLWDENGLDLMFRSNEYLYEESIAVDIWNTAVNRNDVLDDFSLQWLFQCRSTLLTLLKFYVPDPFISVVMPCYNQKHFIIESIQSVIDQTFLLWELIIVDDRSPDKCGIFVEEWISNSGLSIDLKDRIHVIFNEKNKGLAQSRNIAIEKSSGHFICALDADDLIKPSYFYEIQKLLVQFPSTELFFSDQKFFYEADSVWKVPEWDGIQALVNGPLPVMSVYQKDLWARVGGYSSSLPRGNEDYDFWLKLLDIGVIARKLNGVLNSYRYKEHSMMRDSNSFRIEELAMLRTRHFRLFSPFVLLEDHALIQEMRQETLKILESRLVKNSFPILDDKVSILFWYALRHLNIKDYKIAGESLQEIEKLLGNLHSSEKLGWQPLYLSARLFCILEKFDEGIQRVDSLFHYFPDLERYNHFQKLKFLCSKPASSSQIVDKEEENMERK